VSNARRRHEYAKRITELQGVADQLRSFEDDVRSVANNVSDQLARYSGMLERAATSASLRIAQETDRETIMLSRDRLTVASQIAQDLRSSAHGLAGSVPSFVTALRRVGTALELVRDFLQRVSGEDAKGKS